VQPLLHVALRRSDDDFLRCTALLEALATQRCEQCRAEATPPGGYCVAEPFAHLEQDAM